jgi:catechol 2,3-dioxygenase-like lactoylglutathione lyase family enzyme/GNAT superfamily N-acetyltransferase
MKFMHVNPILYSSNLSRSLSYYTEVLAFENKWQWGEPPTFGGAMKDAVHIFFCEGGQGNPGTWLSIMTNDVDEYFEIIRARGATIVSEPTSMEWGMREMLVEDPDGHRIRFGHSVGPERHGRGGAFPASVKILHRKPTSGEYRQLALSVGWTPSEDKKITDDALAAAVYAVVAQEILSGDIVGCALVLGDQATYYYIKDVMVRPQWQSKKVGTAMMEVLNSWLDSNAPENAMVSLITGMGLAPFYNQFGFQPVFAMHRTIHRAP